MQKESHLVKIGVNDEKFHRSQIYDRCKKVDLQPDKIAYVLDQLLDLSESIPLAQIPAYIQQRRTQIEKLKDRYSNTQ